MSNAPIAALMARDAVERQFRGNVPAQPAPGRARLAGARALRRLADRLDPRSLSPEPARRARPATHRGSPC
jgi:hypothetical protein